MYLRLQAAKGLKVQDRAYSSPKCKACVYLQAVQRCRFVKRAHNVHTTCLHIRIELMIDLHATKQVRVSHSSHCNGGALFMRTRGIMTRGT